MCLCSPEGLHPHVLNVLGMQMRSRLHMQSSHVPHTTWLINKQIKLINKQINHLANGWSMWDVICLLISHVVNLFID